MPAALELGSAANGPAARTPASGRCAATLAGGRRFGVAFLVMRSFAAVYECAIDAVL